MFRSKKTSPQDASRTVRRQDTANVFSYYANRSSSETPRRTPGAASGRRKTLTDRKILTYSPAIFACFVVAACFIYVSTLQSSPRVVVVGADPQRTPSMLVQGNKAYEKNIAQILGASLLNRSKLFIDTKQLESTIQEQLPELGEVSIIVPLVSRRPIVEVRPMSPALVLRTDGNTFVLDGDGRVLADVRNVDSSVRDDLPVLRDESGVSTEQHRIALPKATVAFVREVAGQFAHAEIPVRTFALPPVAQELHVQPEGASYYIKFDLRGQGRQQVGAYFAVRKKLEADQTMPSQYIDVRVPGKVFYK